MSTGPLLALMCGVFVAYLNGANDVSKGIATLVGSGVTDYRHAILWGAIWTGVGGLASSVLSSAMIGTFGAGLLAKTTTPTLAAALAVLLGVAACVGLATWLGLPVSTTHAIVGSVAGVYSFTYGIDGVNWGSLATRIALPLLLSPVLALVLTIATLEAASLVSTRFRRAPDCLCVDLQPSAGLLGLATTTGSSLAFSSATEIHISVGSQDACATEQPSAFRVTATRLHWLTSGATSLARGLNDAPKIVALVLFIMTLSMGTVSFKPLVFALVTLGMVVGSWTAGKRVTRVLAKKVTPMNHQEGFIANLVTVALVAPGAALGLPMSTTHVSSGAIIGVGIPKRVGVHWSMVRRMLLAWIVTVPLAAALGVMGYACMRLLFAS